MPKRNPMPRALRTTPFRQRRTKTNAETMRQLERNHRRRLEAPQPPTAGGAA